MLVRSGRIAAIGARVDVENAAGRDARRVDLTGLTVVPGFNDCHCHVLAIGLALQSLDVSRDAVDSIRDIQSAIRARAGRVSERDWIVGSGYDQNALAERRHPTRQELDKVSGGRHTVLYHTSGHVLVCNTRALQQAGVGASIADPAGGQIDRDPSGEPTGLLKESAMELVGAVIPRPSLEAGAVAILDAARHMARFGITSATDLNTGDGESIERDLEMYRRAARSESVDVRLGLCPAIRHVAPPDSDRVLVPGELDVGEAPDLLAISATKIFSDGAMSTKTAALREGYAGEPANSGILRWDRDTLKSMMVRAHGAGWQIATHALGDRAVEEVLGCYAEVLAAAPSRDHRHRIEHCMVLDRSLVAEMNRLGVAPVIQPDIHRLGDGYIAALGLERASRVIPMRLFREAGMSVAFSSDAPVIPCDPLAVIRSAMERRTPEGVTLGTEHRVSAMEAMRNYTVGSASVTHTEKTRGRLAPGMLADFAVLSRDPATTPFDEFQEIRVVRTVRGGVETHSAGS